MTFISDWLIDTFLYTGVLIGLLLLVRRPVARHFGPQIAYALWALPLLRFVMPPIVLPAWMNPADPVAQASQAGGAEPLMVIVSQAGASAAPVATAPVAAPIFGVPLTELLLLLWLGGAALFLIGRTRNYILMRRDLLADARPMGEAGKVRLVETPAVSAPVAFGIIDKVVALPEGFMALIDVCARDMAIAHELEHHCGHDLLANIAAQPLLALHWFNPLAWWGWRAMRIDQEAACDARVVSGRARPERATYAEVIAGFAAGEHLALAAPMACPVLGEKSIIHRLRSLTMSDISTRRRRIGIAAITTTALALPLTASISYAAPGQEQQAEPSAIETIDPAEEEIVWIRQEEQTAPDAQTGTDAAGDGDGEHQIEVRIIREGGEGADGQRRVIRRIVRRGEHGEMSEAEIEAMMAELEAELEGMDGEIEQHVRLAMTHRARAAEHGARAAEHGARAEATANRFVFIGKGAEGSHDIDVRCDGDQPVVQSELADGSRATVICHSAIQAHAADGLRSALAAIAANEDIPAETRAEITRELEAAIEEMEAARTQMQRISFRAAPPISARGIPAGSAVAFRFTPALPARPIPMANPISGVLMVPAAQEDCDETVAERVTRATRVIARTTA